MGSSPRLLFRSDPGQQTADPARPAPDLSAAEERALARAWRERGDVAAMQRLVTAHYPLVHEIAWLYRDRGISHQELLDEGVVGLNRAAARFDPDCGFRFATYCAHWVGMQILALVLMRCDGAAGAHGPAPAKRMPAPAVARLQRR